MQTKFIIAGVGVASAALGAVVSWAVTADRHDARHAEEIENYDILVAKLRGRVYTLTTSDLNINQYVTSAQELGDPVASVDSPSAVRVTSSDLIEQMKAEAGHDESETNIPPEETDPDTSDSDEWEAPVEETVEQTRSNLQHIIDQYTSDKESAEEFSHIIGKTFERDSTPPFVISKGTYAYDDEGNDFSKITLAYYPGPHVLLDEDDERVEDVPGTVGWRNLNRFGDESDDPDVVYIRNRRMLTDFEVVQSDDPLPLHIRYGMPKDEFKAARASGMLKMRAEDIDD